MEQQVPSGVSTQEIFLKKWSWGGFLIAPIWALGSTLYLAGALLLVFGYILPFINLGFGIYYGMKGREKAWATGKWSSFDAFRKRQQLLDNIGFGLFLVIIIANVALAFLGE